MAICSSEFLDVADYLMVEKPNEEIYYRSALSRAYYSLYHEALQRADEMNLPVVAAAGSGDHKRLVSRYKSAGKKRLRTIGQMLDNVRAVRANVDYSMSYMYTQNDAVKDIQTCRSIISALSAIKVVQTSC